MLLFIRQISRELFKERTRMILTILAIAWGTFAISSMLAVGEGLRITFKTAVSNAGENLLTVSAGRTSKDYRGTHSNMQLKLKQHDVESLKQIPEIQKISTEYSFSDKFTYENKTLSGQIQAVEPDYATIHKITMKEGGRFISPIDNNQQRPVIVLGTKMVEDLFPDNPNPVGEIVRIGRQPFYIIGAMEEKSQLVASEAPDAFSNWIPVKTYELFENPQIINMISIQYKDPDQLDYTKSQIRKIIALNHGVDPNDESIVNFSDVAKQQETINTFFIGMQIFLGIVGALTLMVAGVGIANVMYASVKRSTHEIGIKMAVGARTYQIVLHYIFEALSATFIGGLIGLGMSAIFVYGVSFVHFRGKLFEALGQPHPILSWLVIVTVIVILGIIGLLAGLFPALQAAKVDPAEALVYE